MNHYTKEELRNIFQHPFNQEAWKAILRNLFHADMLRTKPELFSEPEDSEKGYYMGAMETSDSYRIGLFYYVIENGSVAHKKVGLRNLVKRFINANWGSFDAAIVVFDDKKEWRLSLVCDIKEEATAPKRFTFVFGEHDNFYRTAVDRFIGLQKVEPTFEKIREAFSVDALSDDFFNEYREQYADFVQYITGKRYVKDGGKWVERTLGNPNSQYITTFESDDKLVRDYIKKMFGRIVFLYFLQRKGWLNCNRQYMHDLYYSSDRTDNFLDDVLEPLFFEILNTDKPFRTEEARALPGSENIPYLNGGLFARDDIDERTCVFPAEYFQKLFDFLDSYNFTIDENDTDDAEIGIDPEMLGRIFENLLEDNKDKGAFYTPKEIVDYMCRESIIAYLQSDKFSQAGNDTIRKFVETYDGTTLSVDQRKYLKDKLKTVKICDPAIGSGAFPMGLVNLLSKLYSALRLSTDAAVIKRHIMEQNIYGVDIEKGAVDIARLRFWLAMIVEEKDPIPLPNLHFKIMQGNSLLESYQGVDLSDMTKVKIISRSLFDSEDSERESLVADLKKYYKTSNHAERDRLFNDIIKNVRRQLFAKNITLPQGIDPSANEDFFLWHTWFTDVFENGGFDIVIGNPPYIQLQKAIGIKAKDKKGREYDVKLGDLYEKEDYDTFAKTGDIYCLFYEQGIKMLKPNGHLCYITSNKWMRAGYGSALREFLGKYTNPKLLIDFAGIQIFENATVDTNILLLSKAQNQGKTLAVSGNKEDKNILNNLSDFVLQNASVSEFNTSDSWVILSPIEQSIKRKIEAVGIPLKDWDIQINYGIKTGYNDAFIISTEVRDQILANCADDAERQRTDELIRPILRGRDIKRYGYEWAEKWVILAYYGSYKTIPKEYPSIYLYLCQFEQQLKARGQVRYSSSGKIKEGEIPGQHHWLELDNNPSIRYLDDFYKPKIVYKEISTVMEAAIVPSGWTINNKLYMIVAKNEASLNYLCAFLNSSIFSKIILSEVNFGGGKGVDFLSKIHLPLLESFPPKEEMNDEFFANIFGLTEDESNYISAQ